MRRETQEGGVKPPLLGDVVAAGLDVEVPIVGDAGQVAGGVLGTAWERQSPDWHVPETPFGRMAFPGGRRKAAPTKGSIAHTEESLDVEEPVVGVGGVAGLDVG